MSYEITVVWNKVMNDCLSMPHLSGTQWRLSTSGETAFVVCLLLEETLVEPFPCPLRFFFFPRFLAGIVKVPVGSSCTYV